MKRKVIRIDEAKCTGCGKCIPDCPEGALQIIDGKARLVSDLFCDGLGSCIGSCPYGAISIEEREAKRYDEKKVMENIIKQGKDTIKAHLKHLKEHEEFKYLEEARSFLKEKGVDISMEDNNHNYACYASKMMYSKGELKKDLSEREKSSSSQLMNWPIELALINPSSFCFDNEELVVAADCTSFSYANFHPRFLRGRPLIIFCPKLDNKSTIYVEKLA